MRPTEYRDTIPKEIDDWLSKQTDTKDQVNLPTIRTLAVHLGFTVSTLNLWARELNEDGSPKKPGLSSSLNKVRAEQHQRLISSGLNGRYNPTIAKLILSSSHGYKEKTEVDTRHSVSLFGQGHRELEKGDITEISKESLVAEAPNDSKESRDPRDTKDPKIKGESEVES